MLWTQAEWQGLGGGEVNTSSHIYNCLSISEAVSLYPSLRNVWLSVYTPLQLHTHSITCTLTSELPQYNHCVLLVVETEQLRVW